ncbi:lamin tail domain-containing protein [Parabacteroides sp.]
MKQFILIFLVLLPVCAFAQFTETFDGPEINSVNPWKGDLAKFNISNGQLVFDGAGLADTFSLYLPITYAPTMEWEMDVSFAFKPSNVNKACIYLYRTGKPSDLIFYIQVGSNKDNVSLYKYPPKGGTKAIITGKRQLSGKVAHIKLVLNDLKYWTLYTRFGNEKGYQVEGGPIVNEIQDILDVGSLNISCICKSTSNKYVDRFYYIDNIIVRHELTETPLASGEEPDDEDTTNPVLPRLESIEQDDDRSLLLSFDKPIVAENYSISLSEMGECDKVYISEDNKMLKVVWSELFQVGKSYQLSYSGLFDESGNECKGSTTFLATMGKEEPSDNSVLPGSILINEVMADPKGLEELPETEYIELYNVSTGELSLKELLLVYDNRITVLLPDVTIPAEGYAVLYKSGSKISIDQKAIDIPLDKFPAQLANAGKPLQLKSPSGTVIDEYAYPKAKPAKSWERSPSGDWHLSSDPRGGTPGSVNSLGEEETEKPVEPEKPVVPDKPDPDKPTIPTITVEPGEFIFNELLPNPFTGGSEYIELYNRSNRALPVSGLSVAVRKADGTLNTRYPLSSVAVTVEPDGYVLLTKNLSGVTDFYTIQSPSSLFEVPKLPILANTLSTLVLFRTTDQAVIDEVSYSSKWHASSIKDQKGVALERIDPEQETQSASNWTSASASSGYGTPGYRNSQSGLLPDNPDDPDAPDEPTGIEAPQWDESAGHYTISYYLDQPGYNCRAFVFNLSGQRVAQIANHELLGMTGKLIWDGGALSGRQLQTGVYIFYAEIYHVNGTVKSYKQVFLVR